jgi:hypothetical protein
MGAVLAWLVVVLSLLLAWYLVNNGCGCDKFSIAEYSPESNMLHGLYNPDYHKPVFIVGSGPITQVTEIGRTSV